MCVCARARVRACMSASLRVCTCAYMFNVFFVCLLVYKLYAPRAHPRKGSVRPHYWDDDDDDDDYDDEIDEDDDGDEF